jgi:hypothetical protein
MRNLFLVGDPNIGKHPDDTTTKYEQEKLKKKLEKRK